MFNREMLVGVMVMSLIGGPMIGLAYIAVKENSTRMKEQSARESGCYLAGGIPIDRYCVKPGSFIEVKP